MTAPTSGTFTVGQTVPITWTAGNEAAGSTVALCYDTGTFFGSATWITFSQAATTGTYNWNTSDVPTGTYYVGGYLYSGGKPYYSHLTGSITIQAAALPTFNLTAPTPAPSPPARRSRSNGLPATWPPAVRSPSAMTRPLRLGRRRNNLDHRLSQIFGGDGSGTYNWNTTGVAPGTYYIAGYLYSSGMPYYCHLSQSITIQAAAVPTFNLAAPGPGSYTAGQTVQIQWTAGNVAAGSTIALCYDTGTTFGGATWITYNQAAADGNGTYSWNTTGVAPGTYYVGGYLYSGGAPTYSHLTQSITIQAAGAPTFNLTAPTSGTYTPGQTVQIQWTAGNVAAGSTIALCYDKGTSFGNVTWITYSQTARRRQRRLQLEHHRRGDGYVLHRRLPLFRRQAVLLPPDSADHHPIRRRYNVQLDGPDLRILHRRPDGADPVDGRQRGRRQHHLPLLRQRHFV